MDQDMVPADLVFVLENLEFLRPNATAVVRIDRDVRDYLLQSTPSTAMPLALSDDQLATAWRPPAACRRRSAPCFSSASRRS
jgi:hypothetical protein